MYAQRPGAPKPFGQSRGYNKAYCGNHDDLYCRANSTKGATAGVLLAKTRSGALGSLPCDKGLCDASDGLEILEPCLNLMSHSSLA